ncbi:MAG: TIGR03560 family F420-dependent LLM class oxidoreductase [Acidimicrobiia bacterium]|nr:TIGR03560 family F420-dependent LLM class oxidoreductase [Acidimicrobiia bacterium]
MDLCVFTEPRQGATYEDLAALARLAEELGFTGFFRSDHFLKMGSVSGLPGPTDAWVTLGALARETSRIRLGTLVTSVTFRHPGPLAVAVAQVDEMSGGRVEFGLGAGWYEAEHTAYGLDFPSDRERIDRLEEQLAVITGLWSTPDGETFTFRGRYYDVLDSPALPKPVQRPIPPVIVGGGGKRRTPAIAARFATEYNRAFVPLGNFTESCARVRAACEAQERDPASLRYSSALVVCVGEDEATFQRRAAAIGREPEEIRKHGAAGLPGEATEKIRSFIEAGADRIYLQVLDLADHDHLRLIASEIAPALS